MSKIGIVNLMLQEYANDLGYSTVQDALDDGYHAVQDLVTDEWKLERINLDKEQEKAHEAWEKERKDILYLWDEFVAVFGDTLIHRHNEFFDLYRRTKKFIEEAHE